MSTQDQHNMAIAKLRAVNPSYLFESPKMPVGGSEPWQATAQLLNAMSYYRDMMNARKGQEELYNNKTNQYNIPDSVSYSNGTQSGLYVGADGKLYLDTPSSYTSNGYVYTPTDNGAITVNGGGSLSPAQTAGINLGTGTQWDGAVTPTGQGISITGGNSSANANTMSYGNMANQDTVTPSGQGINVGNTADSQVPIYTAHGILNGESTGTKFDSLANKNTNTNDDWLKPITPTYNNNQSNPSTDISMAGDQNRQNTYNQQNDKNPTYFTNGKYSVSSFKNPATEQTVLPTDSGNEADGRYRDIIDNPATDTEVEQNHPMRALVEDYFANRNAQALKDYPDMTFNDDGIQMNEKLPFKQRVEDYVAQRKAQELANYPNVRPDYSFNPQTDTEYEQNEYYDNNLPARGNTNWDKALNPEGYTGNIDLSNRPQVTNPDGSISTVRSKSFNIDGKEVLLPTISPDGKNLTDQEAIDLYKSTGQNLGVFNTVEEANKAAQDIHNQQAQQIAQPQAQAPAQQPSNGLSINAGTQETSSSAPMSPQNSIDIKGDYGKDANTLMNREQYYNALERDGVKNPFIREALYEQNIAPLEEETRRNNLENAFKTYLNPNATPEEKEKAKTTIAVLTGKPTMWEDRDFAKQQYNDAMALKQQKFLADQDYRNKALGLKGGKGGTGTVGVNLANAFSSREGEDGSITLADGSTTSDCIGKINDTLRSMGIEWTDSRTTNGTYNYAAKRYGIWEQGATNPNVGDIVIGNANGGKGYIDGHAAVYLGGGKYAHVSGSHGTTIATTDSPFSSVYGIIRTSYLGAGKGGITGGKTSGVKTTGGKISGGNTGGGNADFGEELVRTGEDYAQSLGLDTDSGNADLDKANMATQQKAKRAYMNQIGLVFNAYAQEAHRTGEDQVIDSNGNVRYKTLEEMAPDLAVKTYQKVNKQDSMNKDYALTDIQLSDIVSQAVHEKVGKLNPTDIRDYIQSSINNKTEQATAESQNSEYPRGVKPDDNLDIDEASSWWKSQLDEQIQELNNNESTHGDSVRQIKNNMYQKIRKLYGDGMSTKDVETIASNIGLYDDDYGDNTVANKIGYQKYDPEEFKRICDAWENRLINGEDPRDVYNEIYDTYGKNKEGKFAQYDPDDVVMGSNLWSYYDPSNYVQTH